MMIQDLVECCIVVVCDGAGLDVVPFSQNKFVQTHRVGKSTDTNTNPLNIEIQGLQAQINASGNATVYVNGHSEHHCSILHDRK